MAGDSGPKRFFSVFMFALLFGGGLSQALLGPPKDSLVPCMKPAVHGLQALEYVDRGRNSRCRLPFFLHDLSEIFFTE
jgi:hypothetical protein